MEKADGEQQASIDPFSAPYLRRSRQTLCRQNGQSILQIDCFGDDLHLGWHQPIAGSGDGD
jgi:hypothetical protein